jgi:hypothetical protein
VDFVNEPEKEFNLPLAKTICRFCDPAARCSLFWSVGVLV